MGFGQCLYFSFGVSKSLLNEKSAFPRHFTFQFRTLYIMQKWLNAVKIADSNKSIEKILILEFHIFFKKLLKESVQFN